jgi:hypothetical protein
MAIITIGSTVLPSPSDWTVGVMDISKAERNASGTMIIERVTTKRKIELSWKFLSAANLSTVLNAVAPVSFSVTYPDPVTNSNLTKTFFCGDRSVGMIDYPGGVARYKDVKFNLVEF